MGKLIKYEFRKSWVIKAIILVFTGIFELMFLAGVLFNKDDLFGFGTAFLSLTTICALFSMGIYGIFKLHKDLTTKQSYMLFMTPNNSYKILGAKLIENAGSILIAGIFYIILALADIAIAFAVDGQINDAVIIINDIWGAELDSCKISLIGLDMTVVWIFTVIIGYLAVIISASILNGKKFSGLISFIIFLVITSVVEKLHSAGLGILGIDPMEYSTGRIIYSLIYYIVFTVIAYVVSAWIMDNKLSV